MKLGIEPYKNAPPKKWVIILLIVLSPFIMMTIIWLISGGNVSSDDKQMDIPTNVRPALQPTIQPAVDQRQLIIDRLAPEYCNTHQNKRATFKDSNFPSNDGSGWTPEECVRIIEILYDNYDQSDSQIEAVVASKVQIGMSDVAVWYSWGNADAINTSNYGGRVTEQYVYGTKYIYIEDGKVTSYQDW